MFDQILSNHNYCLPKRRKEKGKDEIARNSGDSEIAG